MESLINRRGALASAGALSVAALAGQASARGSPKPASVKRKTYVLVHGGGHGGWCWKRVAEPLREAGHLVLAPSLTGMADRSHLLNPGIDLDTQIMDVVNLLNWEDLRDVILVGHSYGGMVITGVADRARDRIGRMVYYDAAHPKDGTALWPAPATKPTESVMGSQSSQPRANPFAMSKVVNGVELILFPNEQFINAALGVTEPDDVAWLMAKLTPHPAKCFYQPLKLENEAAVHALPTTDIWRKMLADAGQTGTTWAQQRLIIDSPSHDLMITNPRESVEMLLGL